MSLAWLCLCPLPLSVSLISTDAIDSPEALAQASVVQPPVEDSASSPSPLTREEGVNAIRVISLVLLAVLLLSLVVILGGFILTRSVRRHKAALAHRQRPPTPSDDVWVQHKLPEGSEDFLDKQTDDS